MVAAINWPAQHQAWVAKASIAKSWDDYRAELQLAKDRLSKAKQKYQDSVDEWRQGTLLPEPTASPDPSGSSATPTRTSNKVHKGYAVISRFAVFAPRRGRCARHTHGLRDSERARRNVHFSLCRGIGFDAACHCTARCGSSDAWCTVG